MKAVFLLNIAAAVLLFSCNLEPKSESNKNQPNKLNTTKETEKMNFYPELINSIDKILTQNIQEDHRESLDKIAAYIREKQSNKETCEIIFICTHNSRRSHLAQIWAQTAAENFELKNMVTYSGGTEATAFNPRAVAALERAGFKIENPGGDNPHYLVKFSEKSKAMECFSKKYSDAYNPQKGFLAVMVCDNADEACPVVPGAEARVSLPFVDPKKSDGTAEEAATYDARSMQIAVEMYYVMAKAKL
jgi:arsenate reductase